MENPQHERIEQYLDGTLSPEARGAFETELAANPELAHALCLHEAARAAVAMQSLLDRHESLHQRGRQKLRWRKFIWKAGDLLESVFAQTNPDGALRLRWGRLAGAGLILVALLLFLIRPDLILPGPQAAPKPLAVPKEKAIIAFNQYFQRVDLSNTLGSTDTDTLYQSARDQYAAGNCNAAIETLDRLLADTGFEHRPMALLLKGTCQLDTGNAAAALETLQLVPSAAAGPYAEAQWYRALAYLQQGRSAEASEILREIAANPRHKHREEAQAMLEMKE